MKHLFALLVLASFTFGTTVAQENTLTTKTKVVTSKESLRKVSPESKPTRRIQAKSKTEPAKTVKTTQTRPVIEMTDAYIDNQIAEIQKVIDKNAGNEDFNLSGYQKRILYLESRRPKK